MFNQIKKGLQKKRAKRALLKAKRKEYERSRIVADYMKFRIEQHDETRRRQQLVKLQNVMDELERQIEFIENL